MVTAGSPLLRGAEVGDIDVVLLDADIAGCVSTWLGNGGHPTVETPRILATCVKDLDTVIAVFPDGEEQYYLQQLRIMATTEHRTAMIATQNRTVVRKRFRTETRSALSDEEPFRDAD
jgi:hypothetical protein